ncbi:hypothetical protein [Parendozoicomonas haliclonae]|uniref:Uncharacterized protein n=1 Tax=Parendozoicomonas haliclonae TaxID=1960125 RepID=A0A1X7AFQ6_9GAMM|nr:hypothetical protein [Parendozoicomonas haliclonae]SMA38083.1 hypothetical protein EHSB41UT_00823 [Parendozoicomonas haliclonae]
MLSTDNRLLTTGYSGVVTRSQSQTLEESKVKLEGNKFNLSDDEDVFAGEEQTVVQQVMNHPLLVQALERMPDFDLQTTCEKVCGYEYPVANIDSPFLFVVYLIAYETASQQMAETASENDDQFLFPFVNEQKISHQCQSLLNQWLAAYALSPQAREAMSQCSAWGLGSLLNRNVLSSEHAFVLLLDMAARADVTPADFMAGLKVIAQCQLTPLPENCYDGLEVLCEEVDQGRAYMEQLSESDLVVTEQILANHSRPITRYLGYLRNSILVGSSSRREEHEKQIVTIEKLIARLCSRNSDSQKEFHLWQQALYSQSNHRSGVHITQKTLASVCLGKYPLDCSDGETQLFDQMYDCWLDFRMRENQPTDTATHLTFLHGTRLSALHGICASGQMVIPSGYLVGCGFVPLAGEFQVCSHASVNKAGLSGAGLESPIMVMDYADSVRFDKIRDRMIGRVKYALKRLEENEKGNQEVYSRKVSYRYMREFCYDDTLFQSLAYSYQRLKLWFPEQAKEYYPLIEKACQMIDGSLAHLETIKEYKDYVDPAPEDFEDFAYVHHRWKNAMQAITFLREHCLEKNGLEKNCSGENNTVCQPPSWGCDEDFGVVLGSTSLPAARSFSHFYEKRIDRPVQLGADIDTVFCEQKHQSIVRRLLPNSSSIHIKGFEELKEAGQQAREAYNQQLKSLERRVFSARKKNKLNRVSQKLVRPVLEQSKTSRKTAQVRCLV